MIELKDFTFCYPQKDICNKINFTVNDGEHAALIGSSGTGKSTLVKLILNPDIYTYEGSIRRDPKARIGYVPQFVEHTASEITVFDFLAEPFEALLKKADELCEKMGAAEDPDAVCEEYQKCMDEVDAVDGYNYASNIPKALADSGLSALETLPVGSISGGEYKLLSILRSMLLKPQLLIMDEPDVFLDLENLVGLTKLINNYAGTLLVITHSRLLLNQCFDKILHLENEDLQEFPGTYAEYMDAMLDTKISMAEHTAKFDDFILAQEKVVEKMAVLADNTPEPRIGQQLKARSTYLKRIRAMRGENPFLEDHDYAFRFGETEEAAPEISVRDYSLSYDGHPLLADVSFTILPGEKVALVGANGTGKSSLLRDLYRAESEKGTARIGFFRQVYDPAGKEKLSGGEQNLKQLRDISEAETSVLFLDEPTSHLDTWAQIALEDAVRAYGGTVLMVSHDFYTVTNCADRVLILENGTVREMSGRAYRKQIYKKYFGSDIFAQERARREKEVQVNRLLKEGKWAEAGEVFRRGSVEASVIRGAIL